MSLQQTKKIDSNNKYYRNPVINFDKPDVAVFREGNDYYLTGSHSTFPSLPIYHSRDLVHWELLYYAITDPSYGVWGGAPDLLKYGDTYYLYLMNGTDGIYVMTCTDIVHGNWSAPQPLHLGPVKKEDWPEGANIDHWDYNLGFIDPGHIVGEDGKRYLFVSGGFMVGLSDDGLRVVTPPRKVYEPWPIPEDWFIEGYYIEAMSLFKRGDYFYLMAAQGGTFGPATGHMAVSMRSKSVFGPWEHSPYNPIVHADSSSDPWWCRGHATVLDDRDGNWWIIYHAEERDYRNHGRKTLLEPIVWDENGWFHVPEGMRPEQPLPMPAGEPVEENTRPSCDEFYGPELEPQWGTLSLKAYRKDHFVFRDGGLALKAYGDSLPEGNILALNNGDHSFQMSVELATEDGAAGGMGLYLCPGCYISLELKDGEISVCRPARGGAYWKRQIGAKKIRVELTCLNNLATFRVEADGKAYHPRFDTELSTWCQDSFGMVPVHPSLFSYGTGAVVFRHFTYRNLN